MCAAAVGRGSCVKLTGSDTVTAVLLTFGVRRRVSSTFTRRRISAAFTNKTFRRCYVYMSVCLLLTLSDYAVEHFLIFSFDFSPLTFVRQLQFSDTTNSMSVTAISVGRLASSPNCKECPCGFTWAYCHCTICNKAVWLLTRKHAAAVLQMLFTMTVWLGAKAMSRLRRLVAGLSVRRLAFLTGPDHVGFVVGKVARRPSVSPSTSLFPLLLSFHQCSVFIYSCHRRCMKSSIETVVK
jgi:hypothetical protein